LTGALALILFAIGSAHAAAPPDTAHRSSSAPVDSVHRVVAPVDSVHRSSTAPVDTAHRAASLFDTLTRDTTRPLLPVFKIKSPWADAQDCRDGVEKTSDCWRRDPDLAEVGTGFAGIRAHTLSLTNWQPAPIGSPYFPAWSHSPYRNGSLAPMERFAIRKSGGDAQGIEEIWTPVAPLDTPTTRLDWERGPFVMNVFDLRLRRMLSDRIYLGMDYYSATGDSLTYDYQFNVHQPYLGGFGFLGKIYGPIDRDSASLVLGGTSHTVQALAIRPRVGVWLDTNRVLEFYLDHLKNSTSLTLPQGPSKVAGVDRPGGIDSLQALIPSSFSSTSEGVLYGESHQGWASQWEAGHTSIDKNEFRPGDSAASIAGTDLIQADIYRLRAAVLGSRLPARPFLTLESRSETWSGDSAFSNPKSMSTGWNDVEDADLGIRPDFGPIGFSADAGLSRDSRMDDQVFWLQRFGASAHAALPLGLGAEAGFSSRMQDPEWEVLYRSNPARFLYANPDLRPRTDRGFRGSLSWTFSHFSVDGGVDFFRSEDAWLPRVLPNPQACQDLADSLYAGLESNRCLSSSGSGSDSTRPVIADSLALALRNYGEDRLDAWHLGLGLAFGNWQLQLRDRFLLTQSVTDAGLAHARQDLSVPARVFKGRLGWKRDLVDGKLHLDLAWDWEWYSARYAWAPDLKGNSRLEKLDEYLALDFQAAMRIKTFTLFFRSLNMNHDRYATEPGVHPAGINFRFGVDWTLTN